MIPGLQNVKFIRYGSLHRNTFINGPLFLEPTLEMKGRPGLFFAGQVSGVEGYVESSAMGILAGINAARLIKGLALVTPPETTAHGALITHLTKTEPGRFQPTNVIFSLFPPLDVKVKKKEERRELSGEKGASGPRRHGRNAWMDENVKGFLSYLRFERGASENTVVSYENDLRQFAAHLKGSGDAEPDLLTVDNLDVRGFLASLVKQGLKKSSAQRKLAGIRSFYRYLFREGLIEKNPAKVVATPRKEKSQPSVLSVDDAVMLVEAPRGDTLDGLRDRAILEIFYSAGVRISELQGLNREQVDLPQGLARVTGKGNKERFVPLGAKAVAAISAYISAVRRGEQD